MSQDDYFDRDKSYNHDARIAVLESQMKKLVGNGQPGIITILEKKMGRLELLLLGLIMAALASGSGTVSLKALLEWIGK